MIRPRSESRGSSRAGAFSLVEVVVATGIFAIAIVSVIGLVAAVTKNVSEIRDGDDASRVMANLQSKLKDQGFTALRAYMGDVTGKAENARIYANRDGTRIGLGNATAVWDPENELTTQEENAQKYFLIELRPNATLSPNSGALTDANSGYLAFTVRLIYPAYLGDGTRVADSSQQSIAVVPIAVTR